MSKSEYSSLAGAPSGGYMLGVESKVPDQIKNLTLAEFVKRNIGLRAQAKAKLSASKVTRQLGTDTNKN
jgi:hypothetical protein